MSHISNLIIAWWYRLVHWLSSDYRKIAWAALIYVASKGNGTVYWYDGYHDGFVAGERKKAMELQQATDLDPPPSRLSSNELLAMAQRARQLEQRFQMLAKEKGHERSADQLPAQPSP